MIDSAPKKVQFVEASGRIRIPPLGVRGRETKRADILALEVPWEGPEEAQLPPLPSLSRSEDRGCSGSRRFHVVLPGGSLGTHPSLTGSD